LVSLNINFFGESIALLFQTRLPVSLVQRLLPPIAAYRQTSFSIADFDAEHAASRPGFRYHVWTRNDTRDGTRNDTRDGTRDGTRDEGPVAFCRTEETPKGRLYLSSFLVAPPYRGTGVASAFLADVLRGARARGYEEILLKVHEDNVAAQRLYLHAGFEVQQKWNKRYEMRMM
jgi:ribosomal protein S18 acetylase RimI-like enzyme